MFYSANTGGFYDDPTRYDNPPDDLKEISDDLYLSLNLSNRDGQVIVPDKKGMPSLVWIEPSNEEKNKLVERQRLSAYADPVTGSDRFFAEASRLMVKGASQEEITKVVSQGDARYAEIKEQYPWSKV